MYCYDQSELSVAKIFSDAVCSKSLMTGDYNGRRDASTETRGSIPGGDIPFYSRRPTRRLWCPHSPSPPPPNTCLGLFLWNSSNQGLKLSTRLHLIQKYRINGSVPPLLIHLRFCSLFLAQQPPVSQGLLIHEVSRSHTTTYQSVGLLQTSDQLVAETST